MYVSRMEQMMRNFLGGGLLVLGLVSGFTQTALSEVAPTKTPTCVTSACHGKYQNSSMLHKPLKIHIDGCTVCHNLESPKQPGKAVAGQPKHPRMVPLTEFKVNEVCLTCHDDLRDALDRHRGQGSSIHRPITEQSCIACHNPHASKNKNLLTEKKASPDLCFTCHKEIAELVKNASVHHTIVTEKNACFQCHEAHSSSQGHLLKSQPAEQCLKCHDREQKTKDGRVVKNITLDDGKVPSHKTLLTTSCSICHNPHGSNLEHLMKSGPFVFNRIPKSEGKAADCVECHAKTTPMAVRTWSGSLHAQVGVTCLTCHEVKKEEPGYNHHDVRITMIVSPKVCGSCHKTELAEMAKTSHGTPLPGHEVIQTNGKPDAKNWPMSPIGRINPDGSAGSCTICHARHDFTAENARQPGVCISCHTADGSAEAWLHSPHGAAFRDLKSGPRSFAAGGEIKIPTCVTCHMSDNGSGGKLTHDVTARLSWKMTRDASKFSKRPDAETHRDSMTDTCTQCHGGTFVENAFGRIDESITEGTSSKSFPPQSSYLGLPAALPHLSPADRSSLKAK